MLQVISFILNCVINFAKMLFTINIGDGLSLGLLCCIIFIFLPMLLRIVYFLRSDVVEELNERYDESRPREFFTSSENNYYNPKTGKVNTVYHQSEGIKFRSRYRSGRPSIKRRSLR